MPNGSFYNLKGNIYYCVLVEKSLSSEMVHFTSLIAGLYYLYGIWDQKVVHFIISKVIFTIVFSIKSHSQVKWYILPFQLMYVLFLWCMRPEDGSFVNLKGKNYYFMFSKKLHSSKWYILPFQLTYILFLWYIRPAKEAKFIFSCCWSSLVLSVLNHFEIWFKK